MVCSHWFDKRTAEILRFLRRKGIKLPAIIEHPYQKNKFCLEWIDGPDGIQAPREILRNYRRILENIKKLFIIELPSEYRVRDVTSNMILDHYMKYLNGSDRSLTAEVKHFHKKLKLKGDRFLCHHDLAPRNIVFRNANFYIIDWEMLGINNFPYDKGYFLAHVEHVAYHFQENLDIPLEEIDSIPYLCGLLDVYLDHFHPLHKHQVAIKMEKMERKEWRRRIINFIRNYTN